MKAIISTISGAQDSKKRTADGCADDGSDFGDRDEDWNVYRQIAKEDDSGDSEDDGVNVPNQSTMESVNNRISALRSEARKLKLSFLAPSGGRPFSHAERARARAEP